MRRANPSAEELLLSLAMGIELKSGKIIEEKAALEEIKAIVSHIDTCFTTDYILKKIPGTDRFTLTFEKVSPLEYAVWQGKVDLVKYFLSQLPKNAIPEALTQIMLVISNGIEHSYTCRIHLNYREILKIVDDESEKLDPEIVVNAKRRIFEMKQQLISKLTSRKNPISKIPRMAKYLGLFPTQSSVAERSVKVPVMTPVSFIEMVMNADNKQVIQYLESLPKEQRMDVLYQAHKVVDPFGNNWSRDGISALKYVAWSGNRILLNYFIKQIQNDHDIKIVLAQLKSVQENLLQYPFMTKIDEVIKEYSERLDESDQYSYHQHVDFLIRLVIGEALHKTPYDTVPSKFIRPSDLKSFNQCLIFSSTMEKERQPSGFSVGHNLGFRAGKLEMLKAFRVSSTEALDKVITDLEAKFEHKKRQSTR